MFNFPILEVLWLCVFVVCVIVSLIVNKNKKRNNLERGLGSVALISNIYHYSVSVYLFNNALNTYLSTVISAPELLAGGNQSSSVTEIDLKSTEHH